MVMNFKRDAAETVLEALEGIIECCEYAIIQTDKEDVRDVLRLAIDKANKILEFCMNHSIADVTMQRED